MMMPITTLGSCNVGVRRPLQRGNSLDRDNKPATLRRTLFMG
jgi:hypothetical protein